MPNIFSIIGSAWDFYKKQTVLNSIILWMLMIPMTIINSIEILNEYYFDDLWSLGHTFGMHSVVAIVLVLIVLYVILLWGVASVLVVGKRLMQAKAGRNRTSFKAVRTKAIKFISNLLLTGILRSCFVFLWSLLLIIPGIIYGIRTSFYQIAIVCEGKEYREALDKSKKVVKGHTWTAFWYTIGLSIVICAPATLLSGFAVLTMDHLGAEYILVAGILEAGISSIAIALFTLTQIILYKSLKKL